MTGPGRGGSPPPSARPCRSARDELTREQKIEILRRGGYDALELQVAEEENMGSEQPSDILDRVLQALRTLNAGPDPEHSPPTKHGGV